MGRCGLPFNPYLDWLVGVASRSHAPSPSFPWAPSPVPAPQPCPTEGDGEGGGTREGDPHLLPPRGEPRVPPDASPQVELALAVAAEVDGAGRDVDVHQVVHGAALDVALHPVGQVPQPHVEDLDVGQPAGGVGDPRSVWGGSPS